MYYQTTPLTEDQRAKYTTKAQHQNERVLHIFGVTGSHTPSEVHKLYCQAFKEVPITSIRRSITTLTDRGELVKTDILKPGPYQNPEHVWEIRRTLF